MRWQEGLLTELHADVAQDWIVLTIEILGTYRLRHVPHVTAGCVQYHIM